MILLDTTVLVYAVGGDHPLREPCTRLLQAHVTKDVHAGITDLVVQEFVHVFSRRRDRATATTAARRYMEMLTLVTPTPTDLELAFDIYERHDRVGSLDAILAGITVGAGLDALVSSDRAFGTVAGLNWVAPGTPAFDALVAGGD